MWPEPPEPDPEQEELYFAEEDLLDYEAGLENPEWQVPVEDLLYIDRVIHDFARNAGFYSIKGDKL